MKILKKTKTSKTFQTHLLRTKRKVTGKGRLLPRDLLPEVRRRF
jgi:hypothetical protein